MDKSVELGVTGQSQVVDMSPEAQSPLEAILREGARRMLLQAIESEVDDYIATNAGSLDAMGHRLVVRNGHGRERTILAPNGPLKVRAPRINDKRLDAQGRRFRFTSKILPPYLRKTKSIEELVPWLYRKGISTGDFTEALQALLGPQAPGLSATTVVRLKDRWAAEYREWSERDL